MPPDQVDPKVNNVVVGTDGFDSNSSIPPTPIDPVAIKALIDPEIKDLENRIADYKKEMDGYKKELITVLGIFASFITFVTVEFKFLDMVNSTGDFIALTLVLLSGLMFFVTTLQSTINEKIKLFESPVFKTAVTLCILGILIYGVPRTISHLKLYNQNHTSYYIIKASQ